MAIFNYFEYAASPSMSPKLNEPFFIHCRFDLRQDMHIDTSGNHVQKPSSGDDFRLAELKDHWIITNAWYRVRHASTATCGVDLGTTQGGVDIATNIAIGTAADWVQAIPGKDTAAGTTGNHIIMGADGYVWANLDNAGTGGVLEVVIEVVAGDRESASGQGV
jgi:hypothetical protein